MDPGRPLSGIRIAITRPVGSGAALARRVRALGATPLLLPGSTLRAAADPHAARRALRAALACDAAIFTSPAAVRFARQLAPLHGRARPLAPGAGTRRALIRAGARDVAVPVREDSEGLLALSILDGVHARRVAIVGAPGGRGLLDSQLTLRGIAVQHAFVYQRAPARLDRRHVDALLGDAARPLYVLLSSSAALTHILEALPAAARHALLAGVATCSSGRIAEAAHAAGFARVLQAGSPHVQVLLAAVLDDRA